MLRAEFDSHPLWVRISDIHILVDQVRDLDEIADLPYLERIELYVRRVEVYRRIAGDATFFTANMLDNANASFTEVLNGLHNRINIGSAYLPGAAVAAENVLNVLGPWPKLPPKGLADSTRTLFEDLLEAQRQSVDMLLAKHAAFRADVDAIQSNAQTRQEELFAELERLRSEGTAVAASVGAERTRLDRIAENGVENFEKARAASADEYRAWLIEQEKSFKAAFAPLTEEMTASLQSGRATLKQLKETETQYANLASVAAGETLANHFATEASFSRKAGLSGYIVGGAFLVGAAVPLIFLLFDSSLDRSGTVEWGRIAVRAVLAVVAGSAATVSIRVGSRLLTEASQAKRMELELRAFDPFMSNMNDRDAVDAARVELVDRTFGRSTVIPNDGQVDVLPVGTFTQILGAVSKLLGR